MDSDVLEQLYRKYYGAALLYCRALCGDDQLAQDLTADAFVKAYLFKIYGCYITAFPQRLLEISEWENVRYLWPVDAWINI